MRRFGTDQGTPNERSGQSMIGTTPLNWSIFGRRQQLTLLSDKATQQGALFSELGGGQQSARLMATMDAVNREFGRNTLRAAASGIANAWAMRAGNRSPCYTTRWEELPKTR